MSMTEPTGPIRQQLMRLVCYSNLQKGRSLAAAAKKGVNKIKFISAYTK